MPKSQLSSAGSERAILLSAGKRHERGERLSLHSKSSGALPQVFPAPGLSAEDVSNQNRDPFPAVRKYL
jgi:hypothetical protein